MAKCTKNGGAECPTCGAIMLVDGDTLRRT